MYTQYVVQSNLMKCRFYHIGSREKEKEWKHELPRVPRTINVRARGNNGNYAWQWDATRCFRWANIGEYKR